MVNFLNKYVLRGKEYYRLLSKVSRIDNMGWLPDKLERLSSFEKHL